MSYCSVIKTKLSFILFWFYTIDFHLHLWDCITFPTVWELSMSIFRILYCWNFDLAFLDALFFNCFFNRFEQLSVIPVAFNLGSVYCTVPVANIKLLLHQITFFALIRFKYSTLTHQIRSPDGIVVSTLGCNAEGWDIDTRWTRFLRIALESYFASKSFFFSKILLLELGFRQRC